MDGYNVLIGLPQNCSPHFEEEFSGDVKDIIGDSVKSVKCVRSVSDYRKQMETEENSFNLVIVMDDLGMADSYSRYMHERPDKQINYIIVVPDDCRGSSQIAGLLNNGLYNALYAEDAKYQMLKNLIFHPRNKAEAELYYGLYYDRPISDCVVHPVEVVPKEKDVIEFRKRVAEGLYITRVHAMDARRIFRKDIGEDSVTQAFIKDMSHPYEVLNPDDVKKMPPFEFELDPPWVEKYIDEIKKYLQQQGSYFFQSYESGKITRQDFSDRVREHVDGYELNKKQKKTVYEAFMRDIVSYGKLDVVMNTPDISDIRLLNKNTVTVQYKGNWYLSNIKFASDEEYQYFINRICTKNHVAVNIQEAEIIFSDPYTNPNARLRFTASHSIVNSSGTMSMHIRKIDKVKKTTQQLIADGFFTLRQAMFLVHAIRQGKSIIVVGGSGSGKTVLLNWLLEFLYKGICGQCVQESDELFCDSLLNMEFKQSISAKGESKVEHTLLELTTMALLKNIQLFIIGEIKGAEARDYLTACISAQTLTSTHGISEFEALPRIVDLAKYKSDFSEEDLLKRLSRNVDYVVYMEKYQVKRIAGVVGWDEDRRDVIYDLYDFAV